MNRQRRLEHHVKEIIALIGEDPTREGLRDTPTRVARMFSEVFRGYNEEARPKVTKFPNGEDGIHYDQMIFDTGHFFSFCEHHMVPFFGTYHFAYIPNKTVLGLSKVARIVDYYASKLQVQERLTKEIIDVLWNEVKPHGMGLVLKARHLCREMRGVKKVGGEMITSDLRGNIRDNSETRAEFFRMINGGTQL